MKCSHCGCRPGKRRLITCAETDDGAWIVVRCACSWCHRQDGISSVTIETSDPRRRIA